MLFFALAVLQGPVVIRSTDGRTELRLPVGFVRLLPDDPKSDAVLRKVARLAPALAERTKGMVQGRRWEVVAIDPRGASDRLPVLPTINFRTRDVPGQNTLPPETAKGVADGLHSGNPGVKIEVAETLRLPYGPAAHVRSSAPTPRGRTTVHLYMFVKAGKMRILSFSAPSDWEKRHRPEINATVRSFKSR